MNLPEQSAQENIFQALYSKSVLKQVVYSKTLEVFNVFRETALGISDEFAEFEVSLPRQIPFEFTDRGPFEFEIHFGGDILIFMMHTNVFEFSRYHEVMKTPYVMDDKERSYCGLINIYNFLADSFKYNRLNDLGYMIGRIFVNKEQNYFIEGKREIGFLYTNFGSVTLDEQRVRQILLSAVMYTLNFDLLTPPFDEVKEVRVSDMLATIDALRIRTGKRLGFKFQADKE